MPSHKSWYRTLLLYEDHEYIKIIVIVVDRNISDAVYSQSVEISLPIPVISPKLKDFLQTNFRNKITDAVGTYSENSEVPSPREQGLISSFQTPTHFQTQQ